VTAVAPLPVSEMAEALVLTPHAIANFKSRAKLGSVVFAVDEIRRLFAVSAWCGRQKEAKGHSQGKSRRGRNNAHVVDIYQARDVVAGCCWTFFVRGKILLTVHGPHE